MSRLLSKIIAPCIILFCITLTTHSQTATATLSGNVQDQNGSIVPAASVLVQNTATALDRHAVTNDSGNFTVPLLPPGTYTVTVQREGFAVVRVPDIVLNVGDQKSLTVQLKVGDVKTEVVVTPDASLINTSTAVATTVDRTFVGNLPLNGRSFQTLIALDPGVVIASGDGQFSVNGQRTNSNYFTVDGVSANVSSTSTSTLIGGGGGLGQTPTFSSLGTTSNLVTVDSLEEFKIQTSTYAAEFGREPGGQVQLQSRSGSDQFHGTGFEYLRNEIFDANNWFVNRLGLSKPKLRLNEFGGTFGGPIILPRFGDGGGKPWYSGKNQTFFFLSYEGVRLQQPVVANNRPVPSMSLRDDTPIALRPLLDAFPIPTGPENTQNRTATFSASYSNSSLQDAFSLRLDHVLTKKVRIFGRYSKSPSYVQLRNLSQIQTQKVDTESVTVGATQTLSQKIFNDLRFNYTRTVGAGTNDLDTFGGAQVPSDSFLFPYPNTSRNTSETTLAPALSGIQSLMVGNDVTNPLRQINLIDGTSITRGEHMLKFGVDYRNMRLDFQPFNYQLFLGSSISQLTDSRINAEITTLSSIPIVVHNTGLYFQDTWRVSQRLTLDYGVRWDINPAPTGKEGKNLFGLSSIDDFATIRLAPAGTPLYPTRYNSFAPRIGVAYLVRRHPGSEFVLRGGFGTFYDLGMSIAATSSRTFPYSNIKSLEDIPFPLDSGALDPPTPPSLNPPYDSKEFVAFDPNYVPPRTYQWSIAAEKSLGSNQSITVSYVGAAGRNLTRYSQLLQDISGVNPAFTGSTRMYVVVTDGTSDYRALQAQFQRRLSRGLQAVASYSWSRSVDTASNDGSNRGTPQLGVVDLDTERGASSFDVRHKFNAAIYYDIPKLNGYALLEALLNNWSVGVIGGARTAFPIDVEYRRTITGFFNANVRPDLVPNVPIYLHDAAYPGGLRINPAAFSIPVEARQGHLVRNSIRGFSQWQIDASLARTFPIRERLKLQFRIDAFNALNIPNFGNPLANLGTTQNNGVFRPTTAFGLSSSMLNQSLGGLSSLFQIGGPRSMQFSIKLLF